VKTTKALAVGTHTIAIQVKSATDDILNSDSINVQLR
jgi:hypothetical protein